MKNLLKNILVFISAILLITNANAQPEKGNFLVSGKTDLSLSFLSLNSEKKNEYYHLGGNSTNIEANPGIGYLITNGLAIGLQLNSKFSKSSNDTFWETTYILLPFARHYFGKDNIKPFIQVAYGPGHIKTGSSGNNNVKLTSFESDAGLAVFIHRNIALEILIGYGITKMKESYLNTENKFSLCGIGTSAGFTICF